MGVDGKINFQQTFFPQIVLAIRFRSQFTVRFIYNARLANIISVRKAFRALYQTTQK
jgi:hypothetical protein